MNLDFLKAFIKYLLNRLAMELSFSNLLEATLARMNSHFSKIFLGLICWEKNNPEYSRKFRFPRKHFREEQFFPTEEEDMIDQEFRKHFCLQKQNRKCFQGKYNQNYRIMFLPLLLLEVYCSNLLYPMEDDFRNTRKV